MGIPLRGQKHWASNDLSSARELKAKNKEKNRDKLWLDSSSLGVREGEKSPRNSHLLAMDQRKKRRRDWALAEVART